MGQAFDRDGNVLGEAYGDTKREVLDRLERAHGSAAHEIRIKTIEEQLSEKAAAGRLQAQPDRMLQFFAHAHLPAHLAAVSKSFCDLAEQVCATLPGNPERTVALRKLLEAKDCAVRALLFK